MGRSSLKSVMIMAEAGAAFFQLRNRIEQQGRCTLDGHVDEASTPFLAPSALDDRGRTPLGLIGHALTPGFDSLRRALGARSRAVQSTQPLTLRTPNRPMRPRSPSTPQ